MIRVLTSLAVLALALSTPLRAETDLPLPACDQSLPWTRIEGAFFRQETSNDAVLLRGVNLRARGLFDVSFDDGRMPLHEVPQFTAEDPLLLKKAGVNFVRLPISWSGLEPYEGQFSESFLAQLQATVRELNAAGIYVLIDFHQDGYSKETGEDGAPLWAVVPALKKKLGGGPLPQHEFSLRRFSPTTLFAFKNFFENKENIQDRFWPAWKKVVSTFAQCPGVIGFEPMNEPVAGHMLNGDQLLQNFYEGALREMRTVDSRHALWLAADYFNFIFSRKGKREQPFDDDQIVFAPHLYPNINPLPNFQGGTDKKKWRSIVDRITGDYEEIKESYGSTILGLAEWGIRPQDKRAKAYLQAVHEMIYEKNYPSAVWVWKEGSHESWGYFDYQEREDAWQLNATSMKALSLPSVMQAPSEDIKQKLNFETGELTVTLTHARPGGKLRVYLPRLWYPKRPTLIDASGQRLALPSNESDQYLIEVPPQSLSGDLQVKFVNGGE